MKRDLKHESNASLLSTLLGVPAKNLACTNMSDILSAPRSIAGIGEAKAEKLYVIKEVVRRIMEEPADIPTIIHGPEDVANYIMPFLLHETKEHFMVIVLNTKNYIIANITISVGSLTASVVHPREVFAEALKYPSASIILVHNHPSGDPCPSKEDIAVTQRIAKVGDVMDIPVLDHVIIGNKKFISLKEKGLMKS